MSKKIGCFVLVVFFSFICLLGQGTCPSGAGNICSKASGNWSDITIWDVGCDGLTTPDNHFPNNTLENVCIASGHTVTLDTNASIGALVVNGTLDLGNTNKVLSVNSSIAINMGGVFNGGGAAALEFSGGSFQNNGGVWNPGFGLVKWLSTNSTIPDLVVSGSDFFDLEIVGTSVNTPGGSTISVGNSLTFGQNVTLFVGGGGTPASATLEVDSLALGENTVIDFVDNSALSVSSSFLDGNSNASSTSTIGPDSGSFAFTVSGFIEVGIGSTVIRNIDGNGLTLLDSVDVSEFRNIHFTRNVNPGDGSCYLKFVGTSGFVKGLGFTFDQNSDFLVCAEDTDCDLSTGINCGDVKLEFDVNSCPDSEWLNCRWNGINSANVSFVDGLFSARISTKDETGGVITGTKVKVYRGTVSGIPVLCSDILGSNPPEPDIVAVDGEAFDLDGKSDGKVHIKLSSIDIDVPVTIVSEKEGYLPSCYDNNGNGYLVDDQMPIPPGDCSVPQDNCFPTFNKFTVKLSLIKTTALPLPEGPQNNLVGIGEPDPITLSVAGIPNTRVLLPEKIQTFSRRFDGQGNEIVYDSQSVGGGGIVVGSTDAAGGAGGLDILITRMSSDGQIIWSKRIGGAGDDIGKAVEGTPDGGFIVAADTKSQFPSGSKSDWDIWILKVDREGKVQGGKVYGGAGDDTVTTVGVSGEHIMVGGTTKSFGAGDSDVWIVEIDTDGNIISEKRYGTSDSETLEFFDGSPFDGSSLAGGTVTDSAGNTDAWIVKLDASGNFVWKKRFGGGGRDVVKSIKPSFTIDPQNPSGPPIITGYIVTGYTNSFSSGGDYDVWVLKLGGDEVLQDTDNTNDIIYQKRYGGSGDDFGVHGEQMDEFNKQVVVVGTTKSFGASGTDTWLIFLDDEGNIVKQKLYGGSGDDEIVTGFGELDWNIVAVGKTTSFGSQNFDLWVVKVDLFDLSSIGSNCPSGLVRDNPQNVTVVDTTNNLSDFTFGEISTSAFSSVASVLSSQLSFSLYEQCSLIKSVLVQDEISSFGDTGFEDSSRLCGEGNSVDTNGDSIPDIDCSSNNPNFLFIPYKPEPGLEKLGIFIAGYVPNEIDLTGQTFDTQKEWRISSDPSDCSGSNVLCSNYLQFGLTIDQIYDEFGYKFGIGSQDSSDKGAFSLADPTDGLSGTGYGPTIASGNITFFGGVEGEGVNGRAFLNNQDHKWYIPFTGNFEEVGEEQFFIRIPGYTEEAPMIDTVDFRDSSGRVVQRNLRFVSNGAAGCGAFPNSLCFPPVRFAVKVNLKVDIGIGQPQPVPFGDLNVIPNENNTFLDICLDDGSQCWWEHNGEIRGISNPLSNSDRSIIGLPILGLLADECQQFIDFRIEYVVDGFTHGLYSFDPCNSTDFGTQINDDNLTSTTYAQFAVFIDNVKDNLGKNFMINGVCNPNDSCNGDINSTNSEIITVGGGFYSKILAVYHIDSGGSRIYLALSGTKALAEGQNIGSGSFTLKITGFSGDSADGITTPEFTLDYLNPRVVDFGDANCSPTENFVCVNPPFKYKLVFDKLVVQDSGGTSVDVSDQLPNLVSNIGKIESDPVGFNGAIQVSGGKLYIPVFGVGSDGPFRIALGSGANFSGNLSFVVGSNTLFYSSTLINIGSIFSTGGVHFLQLAPSSLCSTTSNILCTNTTLSLLLSVIDTFTMVSPALADIDGDGISEYGGFGGQEFTVQFRYTDPGNFSLSACIPKFLDNVLPVATTISEVDSSDTTTIDGKFYRCSFGIPFIPPAAFNKEILKGNLFLSAKSSIDILTGFFDTGLSVAVKNNPPQLVNGSVSPSSGNPGDSFTFSVTYRDADNQPPAFVRVYVDLNGSGAIGNPEVFDLVKSDINCSDFVAGCVYRRTLSDVKSTATGILLFGFGATDGILSKDINDFKVILLPSDFSQQSCTINNSFSLSIVKPSNPPTLDVVGISGFQSGTSYGLVEPDSGSVSDVFTFMVKYTSGDNKPATFIRINLFFHSWGPRLLPMNKLNSSNVSQLPATLAGLIPATLYDGNFADGEIYFVRTKLVDKRVFIQGIEASDGTFIVGKKGDGQDIIINGVDNDNDGVDDSLEDASTLNNASKIVVPTFDNIPGGSGRIIFAVSPSGGSLGVPPKFSAVQCSDLISGIEDLGPLAPPGSNLILASPLCNIKVNSGGVSSVDITIQLPSPLPVGGKVFKLLRGKIWEDVTNVGTLSSDGTTITIAVVDDSLRDFDLTSGIISDPIGIFAPQMGGTGGSSDESGGGGGSGSNQQSSFGSAGGGGGCYINPKINNNNHNNYDGGLIIFIFCALLWAVYRIANSRKPSLSTTGQ